MQSSKPASKTVKVEDNFKIILSPITDEDRETKTPLAGASQGSQGASQATSTNENRKKQQKKPPRTVSYEYGVHTSKLTRRQYWMVIVFGLVMILLAIGILYLSEGVSWLYWLYPFTYCFSGVAGTIFMYVCVVPLLPRDVRVAFHKISEDAIPV